MDAFGTSRYCPNCSSLSVFGNGTRMICNSCKAEFKPVEFLEPVTLQKLLNLCNESMPEHGKIQAIKLFREVSNLGLKDSKTCIDVIYDIINAQGKYFVIPKSEFVHDLEEAKKEYSRIEKEARRLKEEQKY